MSFAAFPGMIVPWSGFSRKFLQSMMNCDELYMMNYEDMWGDHVIICRNMSYMWVSFKIGDPQVTIVASILSHAHPFSLDDWGVPPWMTWSLLATWGVYPPELGQYRLGLQSLGLSCLQRRDAGEKGKGTNQSMYFLMTPERNSSFAITSHLYNYINKYKYNICIMTLYNYIYKYVYLYLRVYIYVWLSARVHFTTSVIRKQLWKITIFNSYAAMFCQRARLHGCQTWPGGIEPPCLGDHQCFYHVPH